MESFYVLSNKDKDRDGKYAARICRYLEECGRKSTVIKDGSEVKEAADCMIVLGGDGTVLRAARKIRHVKMPILGINVGNLGYLTEVTPDKIEYAIERLVSGDYVIEERMMIQGEGYRGEERLFKMTALNELLISRNGPLTGMSFLNKLNGVYMNSYVADGLVVSTATGSTGYNLSLGGPVVSPSAKVMLVTPVAAHSLNNRTIILSDSDVVEIDLVQGKREAKCDAVVSCDGDRSEKLEIGDCLIIKKSVECTEMIKLNDNSFLETLRYKMEGR